MKLGLFFTRSTSLETWLEKGLFNREKEIFHKYLELKMFIKIYWFTYGINDYQIAEKLKEKKELDSRIEIIPMPWMFNSRIGKLIYSFLIPLIRIKELNDCDWLRTNQLDGAWSPIFAKIIFRKKLLLRSGFTKSLQEVKSSRIFIFKIIEKIAYRLCDVATVSSYYDKNYIVSKHRINPNIIKVLYNYINENKFYNKIKFDKRENEFLFIGRFEEQKNILFLLDIFKNMPSYRLTVYGTGSLYKEMQEKINKQKISNVIVKGNISNDKIPDLLNNYKYFIQLSKYEGMPKTLLEAMFSGCICIGSDVRGINEIFTNKVNGFLIDLNDSIENIISQIEAVVNLDSYDKEEILSNSLKSTNHYTMRNYIKKESNIYLS